MCKGVIITSDGFTGTIQMDCKGIITTGDGCKGIIIAGND